MNFNFAYELDFSRVIPAINIDARATLPIANATGTAIQNYNNGIVAEIDSNTIVYRIETDNGNMAGYFSIKIDPTLKSGALSLFQLRPAFYQFSSLISGLISNFIANGKWKTDYLFG